ncbi:Zn-ribbon domain-containing OB-fold protein [Bosea sp. NPDC055332]
MEFPQPTEDAVNTSMLKAWRAHGQLLLQHCQGCGHVFFYPRNRCPECWSAELENKPSCGRGEIHTFSIVHRGVDAAFRAQGTAVAMAVVKTEEGPQVITRIVADDLSGVAIGQTVTLYAGNDRGGYPLPVYSLNIGT